MQTQELDRRKTVLIVDDEPAIRTGLKFALDERYRIVCARDGVEAIQLFRQHSPDLILLDMLMPRADGFAVLAAVRANANGSEPKIIVFTVMDESKKAIKALKLGADDYLVKPCAVDRIRDAVADLVRDLDGS